MGGWSLIKGLLLKWSMVEECSFKYVEKMRGGSSFQKVTRDNVKKGQGGP